MIGARVVILNCYANHARIFLEQASRLGMLTAGWAWLVTDGITTMVTDVCLIHSINYIAVNENFSEIALNYTQPIAKLQFKKQ